MTFGRIIFLPLNLIIGKNYSNIIKANIKNVKRKFAMMYANKTETTHVGIMSS